MHMRQEQGWQDMFLAARLIIDPQAKLRVLGALRGLSQANKLSKGEILVINEIFHRKPVSCICHALVMLVAYSPWADQLKELLSTSSPETAWLTH